MPLRQVVHPKVVGERLGPPSADIALDNHSHVLQDVQEEATGKPRAVLAIA